MIDHLLAFADEASAIAALPPLWRNGWVPHVQPVEIVIDPGEVVTWEPPAFTEIGSWVDQGDGGDPIWIGSGVMEPVIPEGADLSAQVVRPRVVAPGYHMMVALPALDTSLRDLPGYACRLIADRDRATAGNPDFLLYTAPDLNAEVLAVATVEPTFAGSHYPFGRVA